MVGHIEAGLFRNRVLAFLDHLVVKLFNLAALHAHDMVMVITDAEFEDRVPTLEMMPRDKARCFELGQDAIHGGQADFLTAFQQQFVHIFRAQVPAVGTFKDGEDFYTRYRDFQTGFFQIGVIQLVSPVDLAKCIPFQFVRCDNTGMRTQMQNILILVLVGGLAAGCSWTPLDSVVYKLDIKQGNIIEQSDINQLRPGMEKRQVQFLMGSPMIVDTFNQDRWEYIYRRHLSGSAPSENTRVSLFFDNNKLVRIEGDLRPQPVDDSVAKKAEIIEVPLKEKEDKGVLKSVVDTVTFDKFNKEEE